MGGPHSERSSRLGGGQRQVLGFGGPSGRPLRALEAVASGELRAVREAPGRLEAGRESRGGSAVGVAEGGARGGDPEVGGLQ